VDQDVPADFLRAHDPPIRARNHMTEPTTLPKDRALGPSTDRPSLDPVEHPDRERHEKQSHPTAQFVVSTRRVHVRVRRALAPC
jgi:hypothetical protein